MSSYMVYALLVLFSPNILCQDQSHWFQLAKKSILKNVVNVMPEDGQKESVAKNVILFIGDGMGITTVTAARILKGQKLGMNGEESLMTFDTFDNVALAKTYNIDSQVGDSGACATALMCGVKARFETIGVNENGKFEDCLSTLTSRVSSIAEWAQSEGKSTGFVTTTRVTHATPAALYSHSASRYWESDDKLPNEAKGMCKDIARQLIDDDPGRNINVILGGGRKHFTPVNVRDPQRPDEFGRRLDNRNLIEDWLKDKKFRDLRAHYVSSKSEFEAINSSHIDYLLGLFNSNHMAHESDRENGPLGEPSLAEMTVKAIEILRKNPHGYFLMVESGRIDHGHHLNNAYRALTDTIALDTAIAAAMKMTNINNTLIIVTSDHSHVFTFGGFPKRGNAILGTDSRVSDIDGMPYTTLLYANGPGYSKRRANISKADTMDKDYVQQSAVPRRWDTHGGEDVPVYATGVMSQLIAGVIDQTYISYAISYASCIGPFKSLCQIHKNKKRNLNNNVPFQCLNISATNMKYSYTISYSQNNFVPFHLFSLIIINMINIL